jgi:DNA-binding transcriptional MerR regulator
MKQDSPSPIALRSREAARKLNVSESTLARWRRDGLIVPVKIRGIVLYRVSDLEQVLSEHATKEDQ